MAYRPVPLRVNLQPPEQRLVAGEQLAQGVEQQRLAEAPGARQEIIVPLVEQVPDEAGLVYYYFVTCISLILHWSPCAHCRFNRFWRRKRLFSVQFGPNGRGSFHA